MTLKVNIIVLNYNGRQLIVKYLPSVITAAKRSVHNVRITVLDNCSSDGSLDYVRKEFKSVYAVPAPENLIVVSYNALVNAIDDEIIILLNNDMGLAPDCIDYMLSHFDDPSVFFVAPKVMDADAKFVTGGCMGLSFRAGLYRNELKNIDQNKYSLFIGAPASYDRKKFLALQGYDPLYLPGTYEDLDLCFRGWQRGWVGVYEDRAIAYHEGSVSFDKRFGRKKRQAISSRNAYIFVWKNIHDKRILAQNILCYPLLIVFNILRLRFDLVSGALQALLFLPKILKARLNRINNQGNLLSEKDIRRILGEQKTV